MTGPKTDFEAELRRALRPEEPGAGLTANVMRALAAGAPAARPAASPVAAAASRAMRSPSLRMSAALAASFIAAVGITRWDRYLHAGFEAREQAMQALRLASENLNVVHRVVQDSEDI